MFLNLTVLYCIVSIFICIKIIRKFLLLHKDAYIHKYILAYHLRDSYYLKFEFSGIVAEVLIANCSGTAYLFVLGSH